jgi:hypothetical protein
MPLNTVLPSTNTTWVRYFAVTCGRARMPQAGRPARRYWKAIARDLLEGRNIVIFAWKRI